MRLGFACNWDPEPRATWSGTPWALWSALEAEVDAVDLGIHLGAARRLAFKAAYTRRRGGSAVTVWKWSRLWEAYSRRALARAAERARCDAVVEIQDLAVLDRPFFCYQDLSLDALLDATDGGERELGGFAGVDRSTMLRRRDRQQDFYERASGLLAMSRWLARSLVERSGVPAEKVHVVHPGINVVPPGTMEPRDPGRTRAPRLLFLGRDFHRKGGDLVVAAHRHLRRHHDGAATLTVAGPREWPLPGGVPDGVDFVGAVPSERVGALYARHDCLVMPSRFEAFGIVLLEALSHGIPCVARDAYAMPEVVRPGENGGLVRSDDPDELARVVVDVLGDTGLRARCEAQRLDVAARWSWSRAARQVVDLVAAAA